MSFIDIKDPKKRDRVVADYVATIHRVQQRSEDEKTVGLAKQAELERTFNPVVKATEQSTRSIKESLEPIHEDLKTVSENLKREPAPPPAPPRLKRIWNVETERSPIEFYRSDKNHDKYFAIKDHDGDLYLGDRKVTVDENFDITVDDETYDGTAGLWALIMLASPPPDSYTPGDLKAYRKLAEETNIQDNAQSVLHGRPKATNKWKMLQEKGSGIAPSSYPSF